MPLLTLAPLRSYDYLTSSEIVMVIKRSAAIRARIECEVMKADSQLHHHSKPDRSMYWPHHRHVILLSLQTMDMVIEEFRGSNGQKSHFYCQIATVNTRSLWICAHTFYTSLERATYSVLLLLLERLHHHTALVRSQKVLVISPG